MFLQLNCFLLHTRCYAVYSVVLAVVEFSVLIELHPSLSVVPQDLCSKYSLITCIATVACKITVLSYSTLSTLLLVVGMYIPADINAHDFNLSLERLISLV